jgi:transmembrane sensor
MPKQSPKPDLTMHSIDENIERFSQDLKAYFPSKEAILLEAQALSKKNQTNRKRVLKNAALASLSAILLATIWLLDPVLQSDDLVSDIGKTAKYKMQDGSTITLNTNTRVFVENRLFSRRLVLVQGEALFNAVHSWRPFIVLANATQIRDIGTQFNVRNVQTGAIVTVLEGAVEVTLLEDKTHRIRQVLSQNQTLHTSVDSMSAPAWVSPSAAIVWQQGKLLLDGTPLSEAVSEFQRYRQAPIIIADSKAAQLRISGAYDIQDIEALMHTLPMSIAVKVSRLGDGSVVISSR